MEPEADDLMVEGLRKNYIDLDQYPQTAEIHNRCVQILANLYHAPLAPGEQATGTGCIGSSEAIMLAGLAMKRRWRDRRIAAGLPYDKPNMVFGSNVQVRALQSLRDCSCEGIADVCESLHRSAGTRCASTLTLRSAKVR